MYLKKLYRQSKGWFVIAILFAAGQLFINYKRGIVLSPFFHYGMFSGVSSPKQQYGVTEIRVNGKLLRTQDFSPNEWDNLVQPIAFFNNQQQWNSLVYNTEIKKLMHVTDSTKYTNTVSEQTFRQWYRRQAIQLTGVNDTAAIIDYFVQPYQQKNYRLYKK